ncbi:MAG: DNA polymerase III subunit delta' [Pseudomonadota bacterium]
MARRSTSVAEIEVYPEADRLEDFPHPREANALVGHQAAVASALDVIVAAQVHHAWIIAGPEGIGKATLAYRLAKYLLADDDDREDGDDRLQVRTGSVANRQVLTLSHPGLMVIRRSYDIKNKRFPTAITVDDVRRLKDFLTHKSASGSWRVVVVDRADEMNINASNALLKSLEEPPTRTIFLLVVNELGRMLPTIRSRCRLLSLQPLADDELLVAATNAIEATQGVEISQADLTKLAPSAMGSVRRLLSLATGDGASVDREARDFYANLLRPNNLTKWHTTAEKYAPAQMQTSYDLFLQIVLERMAALIKARAGGRSNPEDLDLASKIIPEDRLSDWVELWEQLQRDRQTMKALNLDKTQFLIETMTRIRKVSSAG